MSIEHSPAPAWIKNNALYRGARRVTRPVLRAACWLEDLLRAKGFVVRPLVPEAELFECQKFAIRKLLERDPTHQWGDYLEFGVCQGHSLSPMYRTLATLSLLDKVRLYGFDSFEGYPQQALGEPNSYKPGGDKAEIHVARKLLAKRGIDWRRVKLVKGWFSDTLTADLRDREGIERVSLANFDCDLYISTAQALSFTAPLLGSSAIFFFDDWGTDGEMINQKRAFAEFLDANPDVHADEIPNYSLVSRVFYVWRGLGQGSWLERVRWLGGEER